MCSKWPCQLYTSVCTVCEQVSGKIVLSLLYHRTRTVILMSPISSDNLQPSPNSHTLHRLILTDCHRRWRGEEGFYDVEGRWWRSQCCLTCVYIVWTGSLFLAILSSVAVCFWRTTDVFFPWLLPLEGWHSMATSAQPMLQLTQGRGRGMWPFLSDLCRHSCVSLM